MKKITNKLIRFFCPSWQPASKWCKEVSSLSKDKVRLHKLILILSNKNENRLQQLRYDTILKNKLKEKDLTLYSIIAKEMGILMLQEDLLRVSELKASIMRYNQKSTYTNIQLAKLAEKDLKHIEQRIKRTKERKWS